ncbi:MAG: ethanolamine ammonia-lyase subunit EutC [Thermoguttaceae bacterium]|jgi:ethanolamine ammonia-lyase small subunit
MTDQNDNVIPKSSVELALAHTPARVLVGRAGPAYRTATALKLREDHAAARDAVHAEVDLNRDFGGDLIQRFGLFEVRTQVISKAEYLRRPDRGRKLAGDARALVQKNCRANAEIQVVIGDGLSATAVAGQAPALLARLYEMTVERGWSLGRPFLVRYCRVGVMNDIGDLLSPKVIVLLIGERPGLATAASLSAYMAFRPRSGHTDADRNLISNIHSRGVPCDEAARRILGLVDTFRTLRRSGVGVTEVLNQLPSFNREPGIGTT